MPGHPSSVEAAPGPAPAPPPGPAPPRAVLASSSGSDAALPSQSGDDAGRREHRRGLLACIAAFGWWGLMPLYYRALDGVSTLEMLAHRVVWSAVSFAILMTLWRQWRAARQALRDGAVRLALLATTVLISINWFTFIYAMESRRVLDASLGYFINPLVSVVMGAVFLRERLRPWQLASVALAAAGVAIQAVTLGRVPVVSVVLAGSFALYGLVRKTVRVDALVGTTIETLALTPLAVLYLSHLLSRGQAAFLHGGAGRDGLLLAAGIVTAAPMLWFAVGVRRVPLSTAGLLQYLAPSGQFLLAVLAFREPFAMSRLASFVCIWIALGIFTADSLRRRAVT